ncbi:MAG: acyltransferase domain-containing protein, partial [Nannocystaceae bacterium]
MVFPGQGGQWPGMGLALARREAVFRDALEACDAALRPLLGAPLWDLLEAPATASRLTGDVTAIQPAIFAVQVALAALWRSWGVEPAALVGHSMGEIAAAQVAGALSLVDAARVVGVRSRLVRLVRGRGGMAVVDWPADEVEAALGGDAGQVSIAAINGPRSTVLSGASGPLERVAGRLERAGAFVRAVKVDYASHSPEMDPLLPALERALEGLAPAAAALPLRSTVTLRDVDGRDLDAAYWARNLRAPVRLWDAVAALAAEGHGVFLEVSPHPVLTPVLAAGAATLARPFVAIPLMRRDAERMAAAEALGALHCAGAALAWERLGAGESA